MPRIQKTWSLDAFDAIGVIALDGEFEIEGTDGEEVELEGEFQSRRVRDFALEPQGRWLQLVLWQHHHDAEFTLRLPKKKAWVVDISGARGEVSVEGIQARLRVMLGDGEIQIQDCRGVFNLASGNGEVQLENCTEVEMPERPPLPSRERPFAQVPPLEPTPASGLPDAEAEFGPGRGPRVRVRHKVKHEAPWEHLGEEVEDWAEWAAELGEKASAWAEQFAAQFVGQFGWTQEKSGVNIQMGNGEAQMADIDARSMMLQVGHGDVQLEGGRIHDLEISLGHGDLQCEAILPTGEWKLETRHGDIQLALPSDTNARLDVATRHGDIESEVPLVRVGRQGPGARHGGRMVGTIGRTDAETAQISLATVRGDIQIEAMRAQSRFAGRSAAEPRTERESERATVTPDNVGNVASESAARPDRPAGASQPVYDSQIAILQALSQGDINVAEAEELLRSLTR